MLLSLPQLFSSSAEPPRSNGDNLTFLSTHLIFAALTGTSRSHLLQILDSVITLWHLLLFGSSSPYLFLPSRSFFLYLQAVLHSRRTCCSVHVSVLRLFFSSLVCHVTPLNFVSPRFPSPRHDALTTTLFANKFFLSHRQMSFTSFDTSAPFPDPAFSVISLYFQLSFTSTLHECPLSMSTSSRIIIVIAFTSFFSTISCCRLFSFRIVSCFLNTGFFSGTTPGTSAFCSRRRIRSLPVRSLYFILIGLSSSVTCIQHYQPALPALRDSSPQACSSHPSHCPQVAFLSCIISSSRSLSASLSSLEVHPLDRFSHSNFALSLKVSAVTLLP